MCHCDYLTQRFLRDYPQETSGVALCESYYSNRVGLAAAPTAAAVHFATSTTTMSNITFKFVTVPGGLARRMSFPAVPTWADLSGKLEGSFTIPKASLAISYIDTDGDTIVVSSDAELRDCVQFAAPAPGKTSDTGECKTIIRCKVLDLGLLRGAGTERPSARPAVTAASDGESDIASSATAESIQGPAEKGKEKEEGQVKGKDETEGSDGVAKGAHDRAAPAGSFANDERMEEDARASIGSSDIEDFRILDDDVDEEMFGSAELLGGARVRGQGRILDENQTDEHTAGNHHSFAHGASRFEPYGRGRGGFGRGGRGGFRGASRGGFGRGGLTSTTVPPAEPTDESPADAPPQASSSPGRGRGGFRGGRGGRGRGRGGQSFMCVDGHFEHGYPCPSAIRHEQGDFNGPHGHAPGAHMPPLPPAHNPWFHPHSHYGGMPMPPFPPPFPSQHTGAFSSPPPPPTGLFPTNEPGSVSPAPEV